MQPSPFVAQLTEIARVKAVLLKQPAELHAARKAVADRRRELRDLEGEAKDIETEVAALVNADPEYKNAESRKSAIAAGLKKHQRYQQLQREIGTAEAAVTNAELDVRRLEDEQRAWRSHLDATAAEVQLLVAGR